jgi:simple sugar transport system permease protein
MAGVLAGLGGGTLSTFLSSSYSRNMTAGRGFIALAALILGKWRPLPAVLACLLFGATDAAQIRLQGIELAGIGKVPVQFIQILPYVVTLVVLAGFVGRAKAPSALGRVD